MSETVIAHSDLRGTELPFPTSAASNSCLLSGENMSTNPDPRDEGPKPPFPDQKQDHPGSVKWLNPPADHGENSYIGTGRLAGQAAIITGADSGIGRATAIAFAKEGADVVLSYLPEEEKDALEVSIVIHEMGRKAVRLPGDIGSIDYARALVAAAIKEFGHLDILVNNAGFQMTHDSIEEIPAEEFEHTFRTNVFGTFFLTQAALPKMKPGASIINTTSIQAFEPGEQLVAYAATKAAIANMTKSLAKLAAKRGVRVNAVAPGPVWTPLIPSTMPAAKVKSFGENTLFKRPAQPIELAKLFVFLASADASYVSGEIYGATGGRTPL
ncbi:MULTISPECIES: SDR family oxidoreductase [Acidobacteriaceae]|uniref:SDR family oxidoreductase n=1 Tax=Acidobacteriaceae TaxID=204434 RepID=UPI0020B16D9F|nr:MULTISPECIES: SDR family oxidoreductase [Acidobacteriaceae]MDW5266849.1 SDR family oxidoreductase [Edaphobacter sp.]